MLDVWNEEKIRDDVENKVREGNKLEWKSRRGIRGRDELRNN